MTAAALRFTGSSGPRSPEVEEFRVESGDATAIGAILERGFDRLAILGSDADAAAVAAEARLRRTPIGLALGMPASELARTFALSAEDILDRVTNGTRYTIDLGWVEGSWGVVPFLNSVAIGMAPARWPSPVAWARPRASVQMTGDREVDGARGVLVMNGQYWAGLPVAPKATLVDGVLDVQVMAPVRMGGIGLAVAMGHGLHLSRREVTRRSMAKAVIEVPERWAVAVDGVRRGEGPVEASVSPGALDLLI